MILKTVTVSNTVKSVNIFSNRSTCFKAPFQCLFVDI